MSKARVLFLCTGNSCRSQMAEGWLRHLAGDRFDAFSAGTKPAALNPLAAVVMKEVGIDITGHFSKHVSECFGQHFAYVVTVCDAAAESCPTLPGVPQQLHWSLVDPAVAPGSTEERLTVFRNVRDEIGTRIKEFISTCKSA